MVFSLETVKARFISMPTELEKKTTAIKTIQKTIKAYLEKKRNALQNITWATGSPGKFLLPALPHTDFTLTPTGMLLEQGKAPLGGELGTGANADGVNQSSLSGVEPQYLEIAFRYAKETKSLKDIHTLKAELQYLFNHLRTKPKFDAIDSNKLASLNLNLLTLKQLDAEVYEKEFKERALLLQDSIKNQNNWILLNIIDTVITHFSSPAISTPIQNETEVDKVIKEFEAKGYQWFWDKKSTPEILFGDDSEERSIPADILRQPCDGDNLIPYLIKNSLNKTEFKDEHLKHILARIEYTKIFLPEKFQKHTKKCLEALNGTKENYKQQIEIYSKIIENNDHLKFSTEDMVFMRNSNPIPLVLATTITLTKEKLSEAQGEKLYEGTLKLGQEITIIITNEENRPLLNQYLSKHKLRGQIFTYSEAEAKKTLKMN